jgi:hypothetical protein
MEVRIQIVTVSPVLFVIFANLDVLKNNCMCPHQMKLQGNA